MQEKVLVLDIDGTLTNSKKEITEASGESGIFYSTAIRSFWLPAVRLPA